MAIGLAGRVRLASAILALVGAGFAAVPTQADAQVAVGARGEGPNDALARNIRVLATSPRNFEALIGAGRAALALGDMQAAAGFFGRAEEVWPASPLPQAGMGGALAQAGDGRGALQYFARATQLGATQTMIGADRGLAYDLLGQHKEAQADYRIALHGSDADEARRRLALSLAITGHKAEALSMLSPLMARGDAGGARCRAFVLALTGDVRGAKSAIEVAMPGSSDNMAYFFRKLPELRSDQKVAAVNLGIFPEDIVRLASASPPPVTMDAVKVIHRNPPPSPPPSAADEDRIGAIQQWLSEATKPNATASTAADSAQQTALAANTPEVRSAGVKPTNVKTYSSRRLWLQLASGSNAADLPGEFDRMKARHRRLFEGISGYISDDGARARLLIGPFRNADEAGIFADDLEMVHIDAFQWTNPPGQTITKLATD